MRNKAFSFIILISAVVILSLSICSCTSDKQKASETDEETEKKTEQGTNTEAEASTESASGAEKKEDEYLSMQLIPDIKFESGFSLLSQKDHQNNDEIKTLATHSFYGTEVTSPRWMLAQWDSGSCLVENLADTGNEEITDGKWRSLKYDAAENVMTFHLDTSLFYGGKPAVAGDYWPHLLIEQGDFGFSDLNEAQKEYYKCSADKIILSMDIRLDSYSITPIDGDWVEAAQFLLYFYVKGIDTQDFCWFGIQLFDNRWKTNGNYIGYDGGKADSSGAMIFSIGSKYIYTSDNLWKSGSPSADGRWVHIEIDIKPFLEQMYEKGLEDGYFKADSLNGLCVNGMNLGWETIATFDNTMSVRNLELTSYIKNKQ